MQLRFRPVLLELKHPFRLATGMRTHTNAVLTEIHEAGVIGYGEAAMPPYYGENHDTATAFLTRAQELIASRSWPFDMDELLLEVDRLAPGNNAAKASIDIALHDLWGKMEEKSLAQLLGISAKNMPVSSFTLGIDEPAVLREKMTESLAFHAIKIKLGSDDDRLIIRTIREMSDKPIYADANQGWKDREAALDLIFWLQEQGVLLIEQPVGRENLDDAAWLSARSPLPIFADESFQRLSDLERVASAFHGVNIKLMKCTGLREGLQCVREARKKGLQLMIGCMTETSCGILAAAQLAPLCDFADLDGCWLIRNNPWRTPELKEGKIVLGMGAGLGLEGII